MVLGNGIAIAGVWIFAGMVFHSKSTSSGASLLATGIAIGMTIWLK